VVNNEAKLGDDIVLTVRIRNNGLMMRTVDGRVVGKVIYHTGVPVRSFLSMQFSGVVSPGQSEFTIMDMLCVCLTADQQTKSCALVSLCVKVGFSFLTPLPPLFRCIRESAHRGQEVPEGVGGAKSVAVLCGRESAREQTVIH